MRSILQGHHELWLCMHTMVHVQDRAALRTPLFAHTFLYKHIPIHPPTTEQFQQYFEQFGKVVDAQIMQDHYSGRSRGFGYAQHMLCP